MKRTSELTNAKYMRTNPTKAEKIMWEKLRGHRFHGLKFRRQVPLGYYIADFLCCSKHAVIEIDGGYHDNKDSKEYDAVRTEAMNSLKYQVIRYTNNQVFYSLDSVLVDLQKKLNL